MTRKRWIISGQRNYCGDCWLATSKRHVMFESWYERDHLIALDFDPGVVAVAAPKGSHSRRSVTACCADSGVMSRGMVAEFRRASSDDAVTEPVCRARDAACQVGMCKRELQFGAGWHRRDRRQI